MIRLTSTKLEI